MKETIAPLKTPSLAMTSQQPAPQQTATELGQSATTPSVGSSEQSLTPTDALGAPAPGALDPSQSAGTTQASDLMLTPDFLQNSLEMMTAGGPIVVLLLVMSVTALSITIAKLLHFRWHRIGQMKPAHMALAHWRKGENNTALHLAASTQNPAAQALLRGMQGFQRGVPENVVREEVLRYGSDALFQLRRGLRPLEVIGSLAPLLGLLGTVFGMITAFQQLESAGSKVNPAILSGGIWEALLTTAVGLCVAIPVVALLNWLERRVDHLAHEMDNLVTQLFTVDLSYRNELAAAPSDAHLSAISNKQPFLPELTPIKHSSAVTQENAEPRSTLAQVRL